MEPVVTIPLSEYEELLKFKKNNTIVIELYEKTSFSSHVSHSSETFRIRVNDHPDHDYIQLHNRLDSFIQRYKKVKQEIIEESIKLGMLKQRMANVPSWIVKLFNRKQK